MPDPNPQVQKPTPKPGQGIKGKGPMGIPIWGWIAAVVIGLGIAYVFAKKTGAASQDTGSTESDSIPSGADSGMGGGVVAPPPPATSPPLGGSDSGDQSGLGSAGINDVITTITDPGNTTNTNPVLGPTDVFGNPVNLLTADSTFPNAGFETSPYIAPSGNVVRGPGGPVVDIDQAVSSVIQPITTPQTTTILPHGQVVD